MADPPPQPQSPAPPASGWRAIMGFVQQWQVLLPLVAGLFTLWFGIADRRGKEIELDRAAVAAAHAPAEIAAFFADPQNTLTEFRATYPPHAFCATLGVFIAEAGRAATRSDDRTAMVKDADEALRVQIEALAMQARMGRDGFRSYLDSAEAAAGSSPADAHCPEVHAAVPVYGAYAAKAECLLALDTYGQNLCNRKRHAILVSVQNAADRLADAAYDAAMRPKQSVAPPMAAPDAQAPPTDAPAAGAAASPAIAPPSPACSGSAPLLYPQFAREADRPRVAALRDAMLKAGWNMAAPDLVDKREIKGDIRIYSEAQRPCASEIATILGRWLGRPDPLPVISLASRYRSLPSGQLEIWLPPLP